MSTFKKKDLNELVGGDMFSTGGDRNVSSDSEIETGPVQKPFNDTSDYEKGISTTTDKVTARYRQDIPWFAVYSFGGSASGRSLKNENSIKTFKKGEMEEIIEDLVKKTSNSEITDKDYDYTFSKLLKGINDVNLNDEQV